MRMRKQNIIAPDLTDMKRIVMLVEILGSQDEPLRNCLKPPLQKAHMMTMSLYRAGNLDLEDEKLASPVKVTTWLEVEKTS